MTFWFILIVNIYLTSIYLFFQNPEYVEMVVVVVLFFLPQILPSNETETI